MDYQFDSSTLARVRINIFTDLSDHMALMSKRWKECYFALPTTDAPYTERMDRISLRQNQILATMWKLATKYGPERAAKLGSLD